MYYFNNSSTFYIHLILTSWLFLACAADSDSNRSSDLPHEIQDTTKIKQNVNKAILIGKFNPDETSDFIIIPERLSSRPGMYLQKKALAAFEEMYEAASADGIQLKIISATRNFDHQKRIWEDKFFTKVTRMSQIPNADHRIGFAKDILRYSSMPGTSRHHWGTDIDINSLEPSYFESEQGAKVYEWLSQNAVNFGFCQPYTSKSNGRTGYEEEKWHWSYIPLAGPYLKAYNESITYDDICCFKGDETARPLKVIKNFVNGIDPICIK